MDAQPTQLRINFVRHHPPMCLHLDLSGLWVLATPDSPATDDDAAAFLIDSGVPAEIRPHLGVCFPVRHLALLRRPPPGIRFSPEQNIRPLLDLIKNPPTQPATLTVGRTALVLEYERGDLAVREELDAPQAAAFVALSVPFVATAAAWARLDNFVRLPSVVATVALNLDGYLEIETSRPQLVEASPLRGLFRLDGSRFGLPLAAANQLTNQAGFVLEPLPPLEDPPATAPGIVLSTHTAADLRLLTTQLSHYGATAIAWQSGLGRRIAALAALEQLDAWPALIVTPPSGLWAWTRHLDMLGRSYALGNAAADVELTTYTQLARRPTIPAVLSIIFDSPTSPSAKDATSALRRLASRRDALRIIIESSWPDALTEQIALMELLRPGEFRSDVPLSLRYPPDVTTHATTHIDYYLARRSSADETPSPPFRRSRTITLEPSQAQEEALALASSRLLYCPPAQALAELLDLTTAGPPHAISPKITATANLLVTLRGSVAVVTRSRRALTLLRNILRPRAVTVVEPSSILAKNHELLTLFRVDHTWPDLREFDHVVVLDYPFSFTTLDQAVGPSSEAGPETVVLHLSGTLDDQLALLATRRALTSGVIDATAPPTLEEIAFLFDPQNS
jgi:hypothetical protein